MQGDAVRERRQREDANPKGRKGREGGKEGGREGGKEGERTDLSAVTQKGKGDVPGGGTDDGRHRLRCSGTRLGSISSYLLSCL